MNYIKNLITISIVPAVFSLTVPLFGLMPFLVFIGFLSFLVAIMFIMAHEFILVRKIIKDNYSNEDIGKTDTFDRILVTVLFSLIGPEYLIIAGIYNLWVLLSDVLLVWATREGV